MFYLDQNHKILARIRLDKCLVRLEIDSQYYSLGNMFVISSFGKEEGN
jgi:hypothetical protein